MIKGNFPGLNIQWPWARLILDGIKTIETRSYSLPKKYINQPLAIIETPGSKSKQLGVTEAKIIGVVTFSECFQYKSFEVWAEDYDRHRVTVDDPQFRFSRDQEKWAWVISDIKILKNALPAPQKRGIVFAPDCLI